MVDLRYPAKKGAIVRQFFPQLGDGQHNDLPKPEKNHFIELLSYFLSGTTQTSFFSDLRIIPIDFLDFLWIFYSIFPSPDPPVPQGPSRPRTSPAAVQPPTEHRRCSVWAKSPGIDRSAYGCKSKPRDEFYESMMHLKMMNILDWIGKMSIILEDGRRQLNNMQQQRQNLNWSVLQCFACVWAQRRNDQGRYQLGTLDNRICGIVQVPARVSRLLN